MEQQDFNFERLEAAMISPLQGHKLSDLEEFIAALLLDSTSDNPMTIAQIIKRAGARFDRPVSERAVKDAVRTLRRDHKFPILARRSKPAGYWWCASTAEMEEFIASFRAQALDELHTLSQIVKHNYPALAGQLSLVD